jgi:glycosyltransferase involved in cell wall biosynthesis
MRTDRSTVVLDVRVVTGEGGGPDKTILNSPRFLEASGYRNPCAYLRPRGDRGFPVLRERARRYGAPLIEIDDDGPLDFRVPFRLLDLCRRERVRIWHGHDYKSNLLGLLLARFWRMKLVTTVHGWVNYTRRTPLYYAVDRLCLPRYEKVLCVSKDLVAAAVGCGVPEDRCLLLENGIDTDEYRRRLSREEAKQRLGATPGRTLIGSVGRLDPEKGFDLLIGAADQLLREGLDVELWIAGGGIEQAALQRQIEQLGRKDRIRLLGFRDDTISFYQAMDVFALSSLREGLPNVLLEAMALEVPVVATRIAGIPGLIQDGENGLLIAPGNREELAQALRRLLADPDLCRHFARAGRQTIETRHSFRARMDRVRAVYDELLGHAAPVPCLAPTT